MIFAIDFDGTLVDGPQPKGRPLRWLPGAKDALDALLAAGHHVIILSCRNSPEVCEPWMFEQMVGWFLDHDYLRQDGSVAEEHEGELIVDEGRGKPFADYYIDDRAIRFDHLAIHGQFRGSTWATIIENFGLEATRA